MPEDIKRIEKILKARQQTATGTPVIQSLDDLVKVNQATPNGIQSFDDLLQADIQTNSLQRPAAQKPSASGTESQIDRLAREFDFTNQNDQADLPSPDQIDMESVATKFPELFDDYHKYRKEGLSHESALNVARSKVKGKITYDKKSPWDDPEYHGYKNLRGGMSDAAVVKELYPHLFPNYSKYIDAGVPHDVALRTAKADYVDIDQMTGPQPEHKGPPASEEAFGPEDSIGGPLGPIKRGLFTTKERFVTSPFKMAPSVLSGPISLVSPRLGEKIYNELEPVVRKSTDLQSELLYAYHQPPQSTGKYARPAESWKEYLDPKRVYNIAGENAPLMGAFIISNLLTPAMAPIVMGTIEGSETVDRIRQYEDRTGKKVDTRFKIFAPIVVGSINAMLEKLGIDTLLGKYPILGKKILGILASPVVESMTEFDQALMQVLAEALYAKEVDQSVVDYIYSKKDEMREEAMGGYILGLMGAPGSIMSDEAVSTRHKTKKFLFEITPELLKEQRRKLKRFLDDEVLYGKVYRVNGQEYIERDGMLIPLKQIKGMPRSHLQERLEQKEKEGKSPVTENETESIMEEKGPQQPQQRNKEEKKEEEEFLTILDQAPPEPFAEGQKPEERPPIQPDRPEETPIPPEGQLKRRKSRIPVKLFMSNVVKARNKGELDFDYRADLEDLNENQLETIRKWLSLNENDPVHRQLLDEINRIQGGQKPVPENLPVPESPKPAEPTPEPPPTVEKPNIEPRAVFEEKDWNRTPKDDQTFWNDAMNHVAEIEESIKGELESLQNQLENIKGKRDKESREKRKRIKEEIQMVLQDAYDLDAYYQNVVVRHWEKTQQEALQRAREAGVQEEHIEDFVIEFMEEISQEQPYLQHNYDRSYEEIFNNLLNDYREGHQTTESKEPTGPETLPPETKRPAQPEKPALLKPEQKPHKAETGKKELKKPEKPKPSPEEIERDLIDRRNRINEGIDLRRKESNDFILESQKLAAQHGYELRFNRSRKKAGLYRDGKKVIARPQVKMNQRVENPVLLEEIPRETREKIREILHQLGSDIDVEGLSKDQIRAAIKDIKTDKGREATIRAQKTINELLDALEKGYVDIKSNRGLKGGKLERDGIPVKNLIEDLPPDRMLEETPEPEKLPPEAVIDEEPALMKEDKDWQDSQWEKEKKRLQRPERKEKPKKKLEKPEIRLEKTPAGDQIVPRELRPQAQMPRGKIDKGSGKPVEDMEGGLFGQEKEKVKRASRLFGDQEGRIQKGDRVRIKKTGQVHEVTGVEEYRGKQIVHSKDEKGYRHKFSPAEIEPAGPEPKKPAKPKFQKSLKKGKKESLDKDIWDRFIGPDKPQQESGRASGQGGVKFQLRRAKQKVKVRENAPQENRVYEVSFHAKELAKIKDYTPGKEIKSVEDARRMNANPERVEDWRKIYQKAKPIMKWSEVRKISQFGKLKGVPVVSLTKGCQRTRVTLERIKNKILPSKTRIEACYGGDCFMNSQFNRLFSLFENMEIRDLQLADKARIEKWLSLKKNRDWLNSGPFIRMGQRGDDSHAIASGLALEWLKAVKKHGITKKTVFVTAGYAPVTDQQYQALAPYKELFELHFTNSGWFHKNEILLRLGEFKAARDAGLNAVLRIVTNKDRIDGLDMPNENFLIEEMRKLGIKQQEILETPFHDDLAKGIKRSSPTGDFKYICCETGKCTSCGPKCMIHVDKNAGVAVSFQLKAEPLYKPEVKPDAGRKADIVPFEPGIQGERKDLFDFPAKKKSKLSGAVKELMDSYGPEYVREMYDIAYNKALNGVINGIKLENVRPTDYKLKALRYEQDRAFHGFLKNISYIQDFYAQKTEADDSRHRAAGKPVSYANRVLTYEKVKGDFPEIIPFYRQLRKDVEAVKRWQKQKIMDREFKYLQRRPNTFSRTDILADWSQRAAKILKQAIKGVDVVTDPELFKAKAAEYGHNYQDDLGIYEEKEGKIYINPEYAEKDTVFHEFAHPVVDYIRRNNQRLYRQGLELVKYTPYELRAVLNRYENPLEEALVQAIGEKGAQIQDEVLRNKFIAWLKQVLREVNRAMKQMFGFELTLDEFAGMIAYQMRAGKTIVDLKAAENKIDFISRKEFDRILNEGKKINLGGAIVSPEFNIMNDEYEVSVNVNPGTDRSYYVDFFEPEDAYKYIQNLRRKQSQFQFAGTKALTADKSKLLRAATLEAQGADMSNIRKETGWFKGPDGKWRFEIDDEKLNINADRLAPSSSGAIQTLTQERFFFGPLGEFVNFPELFKAYPQLKDIELQFVVGKAGRNIGSYNSGNWEEAPDGSNFGVPRIFVDIQNSKKHALDILVHELQHAIQDIEGFARGGSPEAFYVDLKNDFRAAASLYQMAVENNDETEKKLLFRQIKKLGFPLENKNLRRALADNNLEKAAPILDKISKQKYENLAGEIEARDVAARRNLDPVLRALNFEPYTTQKFGDVIIRYGQNGQASFSKGHDDLVVEGEELLDGFFSERDWRNQKASVEALNFQQRIQNTIRRKPGRLQEPLRLKWEKEWQDVDRAIHVYIDMKNNPAHYDEYYDDLKPEQQRIVDLARNLTGEQKRIAEQIRLSYELTGREALDLDIIYSVLENYVGRMWDTGDNPASEFWRKFGTKTRHAKPRVFETILEGWAKGYELKVEGATNNLAVLKNELATVIESKKLIKAGLQVKDGDGNPLFSFQKNEGYLKIEHPNFTWWDYRGSVRIDDIERDLKDFAVKLKKIDSDRLETAENRIKMILSGAGLTTPEINNLLHRIKNTPTKEAVIDEFIRRLKKDQSKIRYKKRITSDLMITPFGDILQRVPVYAPEKFAKRLNRTFGQSKLKGALSFGKDDKYSIIDVATKYNAIIKANILQSSLFHHFAFTRSYLFGGAIRNIKDINVFRAYKDGLQAIQELNPTIELLVRNGLTLGRIQDWEELVFKQHTFIGDLLDKWKVSKAVKDRVLLFREKQARSLFQRYGAGLKAYTAMLEYQRMLHEHPGLHPNDRAKYVANLVNDDFGGLHLQRLGISPTRQHIFRLFALAPDWTESNIRTMVKAVKAGPKEQKQLYRKFWRRVAVRAMTLTTVLNLAMALFDDPDDEETYWVTVKRRYKTAWDRGYLSWLDVDISPVYFALGGDRDKRTYFSVIGHFRDPVKFLRYPAMSAKNKGSVLSRVILESLVGSDWRGRPFTNWDELAGLDDGKWTPSYKGLYKTTSKKFGYKKGDPKGGTLKGRLTKSRYQGKFGPIDYGQVPSFTVHQIKQMMPIQIQMLIGYLLGEEQGLEALLKSLGIGSAVVLDPKYYKNSETQKPETQKQTLKRPVRSERPVRKRLIRKAG